MKYYLIALTLFVLPGNYVLWRNIYNGYKFCKIHSGSFHVYKSEASGEKLFFCDGLETNK